MLAPISLLVDWMRKTSFTKVQAVGAPGVGIVGKNIVLFITILKQENGVTTQKIITMRCVVVKSLDSKKKTIARADIVDIVQNVGKQT
jgi:hypothetical protein